MITAKERRELSKPDNTAHKQAVDALMIRASADCERYVWLPFDKFGYERGDVEYLEELGYSVERNSAYLWWEVCW